MTPLLKQLWSFRPLSHVHAHVSMGAGDGDGEGDGRRAATFCALPEAMEPGTSELAGLDKGFGEGDAVLMSGSFGGGNGGAGGGLGGGE